MNINIKPHELSGEIQAISSKSHMHRLLICAAVSGKTTRISYRNISDDINVTISCLDTLGASIRVQNDYIEVTPIRSAPKGELIFDFKECGTSFRLLLPLICHLCDNARLIGSERLSQRPIKPLADCLRENGAIIDGDCLPLTVRGGLHSGTFEITGAVSSQFISGLLFTLPLLQDQSNIIVTDGISSGGYLDMTLDALTSFGVMITVKSNRFIIPGSQTFRTNGNTDCEGDWSNSAYWLAAGALSSKISVKGLSDSSLQPDKSIITDLCLFGAAIKSKNNKFTVSNQMLCGIEIDADSAPDLVPILAVIASVSEGVTRIYNAGRLRAKESDRLSAIAENLKSLGADIEEKEEELIIHGKPCLRGGNVESFNDHRIVMSMAIASICSEGDVLIKNAEAVNKSYPCFFDDFKRLGGQIIVE